MTTWLLKGAIIQFTKALIGPIPNVIAFQYNPESFTRTIAPYWPPAPAQKDPPAGVPESINAQPQDPTETFSLSLLLDATDALEKPETHPVAVATGIADRLSALEMLLYPTTTDALPLTLGSLVTLLTTGSADAFVKHQSVPITLFVWGPGRIVPVRLQTMQVEEQQWNQLLYPTRAKVTLGMRVVTDVELANDVKSDTEGKSIAKFCYAWTRTQKRALAVASPLDSLLGMLPI